MMSSISLLKMTRNLIKTNASFQMMLLPSTYISHILDNSQDLQKNNAMCHPYNRKNLYKIYILMPQWS